MAELDRCCQRRDHRAIPDEHRLQNVLGSAANDPMIVEKKWLEAS